MASSLGSTLGGGSDDYRGCDYCGDEREVVGYCLDCKHYLCTYCFNGHRKPPPLRHHVLLYRSQTPAPGQQGNDLLDDQLKQQPHRQEPVSSGPIRSKCGITFILAVLAVLALLLGVLFGTQQGSTKLDNTEFQQDVTDILTADQLGSINSEIAQKEDEQGSIDIEIDHKVGQQGGIIAEMEKKILEGEQSSLDPEIDHKVGKQNSINSDMDLKEDHVDSESTEHEGNPESFETVAASKREKIKTKNSYLSGQQPRKVTSAEHVADLDVLTKEDSEPPGISDCVVLQGDNLVVVDIDNSKVKLIDLTTMRMKAQLRLPNYIWGITKVSSTQVAITCFTEQTIYMVSVSDTLQIHHVLKVGGKCRGIAYINNRLVVSYDNPPKMDILDMRGHVTQTIDTMHNGASLFNHPWYIAVSRDQTSLYITDWHQNTV